MPKRNRKEIFTRIDEELYKKIKEKGYKISYLIEVGFRSVESKNDKGLEEKIDDIIDTVKSIDERVDKIFKIYFNVRDDINNVLNHINLFKRRLSEKFFVSKTDALEPLNFIEKELRKIIKKL